MHTHSFKLKKKIGERAYYSDISMSVEEAGFEELLEISYDEVNVEPEWRAAISFGVIYFYEHYYRENKRSLNVFIDRLHTMMIDSSNMTVFFVTVQCLSEMLLKGEDLVELKPDGYFSVLK